MLKNSALIMLSYCCLSQITFIMFKEYVIVTHNSYFFTHKLQNTTQPQTLCVIRHLSCTSHYTTHTVVSLHNSPLVLAKSIISFNLLLIKILNSPYTLHLSIFFVSKRCFYCTVIYVHRIF